MNGMFDWLVEVSSGKVVWKYSFLAPGLLYHFINQKVLELSVHNLVTKIMVRGTLYLLSN